MPALIRSASVFVTQLEQPLDAAIRALEIAQRGGRHDDPQSGAGGSIARSIYRLCDYVTPNETEAEGITGIDGCLGRRRAPGGRRAARQGRRRGRSSRSARRARCCTRRPAPTLSPPIDVGPVVETTGAGDAFNGGLAVGLSRGFAPVDAVRFGCAVAGISVTRPGTAPSMPTLQEVEALLSKA